ncbi:MAG: hypothetical protein ABIJ39_02010 [Chloroflexota bacterium]
MSTLESPESSSPLVTRAVAAGLQGRYIDNYILAGWQRALLSILGMFPQSVGRFAVSRFQSISGLPPKLLDGFQINRLLAERLRDYAGLSGTFPAITIGAALGGATTYLSLALGAPFLPETFVLTLKGGSADGDVTTYLEHSRARALQIAATNPGIMTIQHYDPVHDGWLTRWVNHLRFKLLDIPESYIDFIRSRLQPGGDLVFLDGGAVWLRYRLGERSVFQVGGWGGIPAKEFLSGSQRLRTYARQAGLKHANWKLVDYPLEQGPESEWGSEPGLAEALEAFCHREGYNFVRISLPHPNDFSRLAFASALRLLEMNGREPAGTLIEMFSQFDANAAMQAGLLPLWLIFNTSDSLEYLMVMRNAFPKDKPVFFSPLATFSLTPDLVPWKKWHTALEGKYINIGARPSHYPGDTRALVRWANPLREWVHEHRNPLKGTLSGQELAALVGRD